METSAEAWIDQAAADRAYLAKRIATLKRELEREAAIALQLSALSDTYAAMAHTFEEAARDLTRARNRIAGLEAKGPGKTSKEARDALRGHAGAEDRR